jgi:serine/threonine-protein kinase RsbW
MRQDELLVPTTLDAVAVATQQLRAMLPDWLDAAEIDAIELAVAEALTNIVRHGYDGQAGPDMRLRVLERAGALEIDVWDQGRPIPRGRLDSADATTTFQFDPTDLAALPEGGMGLALIKSAFHEVRYGSRSGTNRLHMVRRL